MTKIELLAKYLECEVKDLSIVVYDSNTFEYDGEEYMVLTDAEANAYVAAYIKDSFWAFNTKFILEHSKLEHWNEKTEHAFKTMQSALCENANEIVLAIIEDVDEFIEDAVEADGRGHFISGYDGEEHEETDDDGITHYIYRVN